MLLYRVLIGSKVNKGIYSDGREEVRALQTPLGLTDFDMGVTLGTGSFGRVRFVTHKVNLQCFPCSTVQAHF